MAPLKQQLNTVGPAVRAIRIGYGLTQEQLVELVCSAGVELTQAGLSDVEAGQRLVTVELAAALAWALNAPRAAFLPTVNLGPDQPTLTQRRNATLTDPVAVECGLTPERLPAVVELLAPREPITTYTDLLNHLSLARLQEIPTSREVTPRGFRTIQARSRRRITRAHDIATQASN